MRRMKSKQSSNASLFCQTRYQISMLNSKLVFVFPEGSLLPLHLEYMILLIDALSFGLNVNEVTFMFYLTLDVNMISE